MIPDPLADLGAVFVPVPAGEKAARTARDPEHLHTAGDPDLRAHLEAGGNYGVTCRGDLAVLDADDPDVLEKAIRCLPDTVRQVSGSGSGEHYFYHIPDLEGGLTLTDPDTGDHVGDVKAAEQDYVIGPGSTHPTGGTYGPLEGEQIATVDADEFRRALEPYLSTPGKAGSCTVKPQGATRHERPPVDGEPELDDVITPSAYPTEARRPHPCHGSSTGANFKVHEGREVAYCYRHDTALRGLHLWAIDEGLISCDDVGARGELDTDTWREVYDAARAAGYDLPPPAADHEAVEVVLPDVDTPAGKWGGLRAERPDRELSLEAARERCQQVIRDAVEQGDRAVIDALPTLGKSYSAATAAADVDVGVTYLTHRYENREQAATEAREAGLDVYTLPVFTRDCPTASGAEGDDWADTFRALYEAGLRPSEIHERHPEAPCQHEGRCPHAAKWDVDPGEYDLVIGHPCHAYVESATVGRAVVIDEEPGDAYEQGLAGEQLHRAVAALLDRHPDLEADTVDDLRAARRRDDWRADLLGELLEYDDLRAPDLALSGGGGHVDAPAAAVALLTGESLGNSLEYATLEGAATAAYDTEHGRLALRRPPDLESAAAVIGLDGTPCMRLWRARLDTHLTRRRVLDDREREQYLADTLGLRCVKTTPHVRPYSSGEWVNTEQDTALLRAIDGRHDATPAAITSGKAETQLFGDDGPAAEYVDGTEHYGNVKSSNQYAGRSVGVVLGSPHYGDRHIQLLAALEGEHVEPHREPDAPLSYSGAGDEYLRHVREHSVGQAALRFGRDGSGATVYVNTSATPEWLPTEQATGAVRVRSEGEQAVLRALADHRQATTSTIAEAAGLSRRQVRRHLERLAEAGHIHREGAGPSTTAVVDELPDDLEGPAVDLPDDVGESTRTAGLREPIRADDRIAVSGRAGEAAVWALGPPPAVDAEPDAPPGGAEAD